MAQAFLIEPKPLLQVRDAEPHAIHFLEHEGGYLIVSISPSSELPTRSRLGTHPKGKSEESISHHMAVVLQVSGEVRYGEWRRFLETVERYRAYRSKKNYVVPQLLLGLSGPMNRAVLVYRYDDAQTFEEEDRTIAEDPEYGKVASEMPYREGSIVYELFREA